MKLLQTTLLLSTLLLSPHIFAQSNHAFAFKTGKVLKDTNNSKASDYQVAEVMMYGLSYIRSSEGFGSEIELMLHQDADVTSKNTVNGPNNPHNIVTGKLSTLQVGSYLIFNLPVSNSKLNVTMKAGYVNYLRSLETNSHISRTSISNSSGYRLGCGLSMDISPKISIISEYNHTFATNTGQDFSFGLKMKL